MCRDVGVALLVTLIFLDVVEVVAPDDNGAVHLGRFDLAAENPAANRYIASKGALVVDIVTLDCFLGGTESETNGFIPARTALAWAFAALLGDLLVAVDVR